MLGKPVLLFRRRLVDDVVGGDCRMVLERCGNIAPEGRCLTPIGLVLPQATVEPVAIVLRPAHAGQRQRRDHHFQSGLVGAVERGLQHHQILLLQAGIAIRVADQEIAIFRFPLVIGKPDPACAITIEISLIRRQAVKAVAAMLRRIPEADQVGCTGRSGEAQGDDKVFQQLHGVLSKRNEWLDPA